MWLALMLGACTQRRMSSMFYEDTLGTRTCAENGSAWPDVFPASALSYELGPEFAVMVLDERIRRYKHCWYSFLMKTLKEGALLPAAPGLESYRFTWMRSFRDDVVIRVERRGPVHTLHVKMGDARDGAFVVDRRILLTPSQWQELRHRLEQARFWSADRFPKSPNVGYLDGATWLLEGVRDGRYHALDVHSPQPEGPASAFRAACLYLVQLSGLSIPEGEVY